MSVPNLNLIPPPVVDPETDEYVKEGLFSSAYQIKQAFDQMWNDDLESSRNRAIIQASLDGAPPFSEIKARMMGTHGNTNVNWGLAQRALAKEEIPYNDLLESFDIFGTLPTEHGDESSRKTWEPAMAETVTQGLRNWSLFNYLWQYNVHLFKREGVSMAFFNEDRTWEWEIQGLQQFKFPRGCKPSMDKIPFFGCRVDMNCAQLYSFIKDPEKAKKAGWDLRGVKKVLAKAAPDESDSQEYEKWEAHWKNHDITYTSTAPKVETIYFYWQELNGTVSQAIIPFETTKTDQTCLYKKIGKYGSMERLANIFTDGIGTNGDLHSIRGFSQKIHDKNVHINRVVSAFVDGSIYAATPHLQCSTEDAVETIPIKKMGAFNIVEQGNTFVDTKSPDFQQSLIPLLNVVSQYMEGDSSGASILGATRTSERKTNLMEQNEQAQASQMSSGSMNLFFASWGKLFKEVIRRMIRRDYAEDEPGGQLVFWIRKQLLKQGVPLEAFYQIDIDRIQINTGIGKGSHASRKGAIDSLMQDYGQFDAEGKNTLLRMKTALTAGTRTADLLAPQTPGLRPGQQVENAILENAFLTGSNQFQIESVQILPDQDMAVHVKTHIERLSQLFQMIEGGQPPEVMFPVVSPLWGHAVTQWEQIDPADPLYREAKAALQQMGEWVTNTGKELAAAEQKAQAEGGSQAGAQPEAGIDNLTAFKHAVDANAKIEMDKASNELELRHKQQMMALDQAKKVQDLQFGALKQQAKV